MFTLLQTLVRGCRSTPTDLTLGFLGPGSAGKTSIAAVIRGEPLEEVSETIGQDVFHFRRKKANITAYDLGGGERIRGIWERYYAEIHAFVFVVDASQPLSEAREVLWNMLKHDFVGGKPVLIMANKQDVDTASSAQLVSRELAISDLASTHGKSPFQLVEVCAIHSSKAGILKAIDWLITTLLEDFEGATQRRAKEMQQQAEVEAKEMKEKQERIRKRREERERKRALEEAAQQQQEQKEGDEGQSDAHAAKTPADEGYPLPGEAVPSSSPPITAAPVSHDRIVPLTDTGDGDDGDDGTETQRTRDGGSEDEGDRTSVKNSDDLEVEDMSMMGSRAEGGDAEERTSDNKDNSSGTGDGDGGDAAKQDSGEQPQKEPLFSRVNPPLPQSLNTDDRIADASSRSKKQPQPQPQPQQQRQQQQPSSGVKLAPLHPLDIISAAKSIKDASLIELVRAAAKAYATLKGEPVPSEGDLQWKMYRAACKECWQQIIKQARKGKRFSMDRLAIQAHTGWSAIVKYAWDERVYGPRPPQLTPSPEQWPREHFETDAGYEQYLQRWEEAQSFDDLTYEQKERYRLIAEVELHVFLQKNPAWRSVPVKHRQQKLFESLLVLECVSLHEPQLSSTA
ncbi:hypothetical protein PTSG_00295 [Salpingoeca rosetta]|uniref:Uncharacterized protein n=1 Tax=Salpingoeca rosetta (strain ATCC 50818 / BSB-021) TaxID=946362 RepID=F2TW29_SALR5|nr:uncharacterized protein PTSG_00295 [Salpingoeca rosetta]EGD72275.1 hypothetical protein PTSG_00295 [Salpingoeca rosetta]|eukprot:XP_004998845.1 hypothetical protein PTSG_00295 [Salpingoeca rosetta]